MPRAGFSAGSMVKVPCPSDSHCVPSAGAPAGRVDDRDLVGDHERGVEADAELADQSRRLAGLAGALRGFEERLRAGLRDRAEVLDHLRARHADAVVGDRERPGGRVGRELDLPVGVAFELVGVGERVEPHLVDRVGRVGDEFAEEDLAVGVERVRDEVEELLQFGFELERLGHRSVSENN